MLDGDWSSDVCSSDLPAGAGLSLLFLIINLELESAFFASPYLNAIWMLCIGGLMISRVPTFSFKRVRVKREYVGVVLLVAGLLVAALVNQPWYTLAALELAYLASIPLSIRAHDKLKRGDAQATEMAQATQSPETATAEQVAGPADEGDAKPGTPPGTTPGILH
jgi:CDP-diacylglycerol--serine O-phosphatidyltransferase